MDRHKLQQIGNKVGELLRFGNPSCVRQANSIMVENFENILFFAIDLTEPKPKPKHTIADNYPAGGLTATEPCMFCEDFEKLQAENERLKDVLRIGCYCNRQELIRWLEENKIASEQPFEKEKTIVLRMFVITQGLSGETQ